MATAVAKTTNIKLGGATPDLITPSLSITATGAAGSTETLTGDPASAVSANKRAFVFKFTVNGQEVDVLVRVQGHNGSLWLDLVASQSVAELTTTVAALSLGALGTCHPSPTKDVVDGLAMVAAGGT